jgi:tetratricopeptide (TPR) repeat protein
MLEPDTQRRAEKVSYIPVPAHNHFVGREDILAQLRQSLRPRQLVGLVGMAGVGKTQLASEYARSNKALYPGGIFWISATSSVRNKPAPETSDTHAKYRTGLVVLLNRLRSELGLDNESYMRALSYQHQLEENLKRCEQYGDTPERRADRNWIIDQLNRLTHTTLNTSFNELCDLVAQGGELETHETIVPGFVELFQKLPTTDMSKADTQKEQIRQAFDHLSRHPDALLIVDNITHPSILEQAIVDDLRPVALPCHILFTTRHRDTHLQNAQYIEVNSLSEDDALSLLFHYRPATTEAEERTARAICRLFGWLPLAINLAGAFLHDGKHKSYEAYYNQLISGSALEDKVEALLKFQWEALDNQDARNILQSIGILAEKTGLSPIHIELLSGFSNDIGTRPTTRLDQALVALRNLYLIEELSGAAIRIHPLIQEFAARQIPQHGSKAFRKSVAETIIRGIGSRNRDSNLLLAAGECLLRLGWSSVPVASRVAYIKALRAILRTSRVWEEASLSLPSLLEHIARLAEPEDWQHLIGCITTALENRSFEFSQRLRIYLTVYRAAMQFQSQQLDAAERDYETARQDLETIAPPATRSLEDNKLLAQVYLGLGRIEQLRADEPEDDVLLSVPPSTNGMDEDTHLPKALAALKQAELSARAYGHDIFLQAGIATELGYTQALLKQWNAAIVTYQGALRLLEQHREELWASVDYLKCHALILEAASQIHLKHGKALEKNNPSLEALEEYELAHNLAEDEIAQLEHLPDTSELLAIAYINAGDCLLAMKAYEECSIEEPLKRAYRGWKHAEDIARDQHLSDWAHMAAARIQKHCPELSQQSS